MAGGAVAASNPTAAGNGNAREFGEFIASMAIVIRRIARLRGRCWDIIGFQIGQ